MTIGAGIAIAGAFLGASLAVIFGDVSGGVFIGPTVVGFCVALFVPVN